MGKTYSIYLNYLFSVKDCPRAAKIMGDDNTTFERVPVYN